MLIPLESEDGKVKLFNDKQKHTILFCSSGVISTYLIKKTFKKIKREKEPWNHYLHIVICKNDITDDNVISIQSEINRLKEHFGENMFNPKVTLIGESFRDVNDWLAKFVHDYYSDLSIANLNIIVGLTKFGFEEIKTGDEAIDKSIEYPFKDMWRHDVLRKIITTERDILDRTIICENPKQDKKFCGECRTCRNLELDLAMIYAEQPNDEVIADFVKDYYKKIFNKPLRHMQAAYTEARGPFLIDYQKQQTPKIKPIMNMRN